ncbi:pilus assembly protein [Variovorax sp. dw_308]|uniref:pilus assembly protein n=1 Tax=Variovorax sp. dw_308 TaxID=2721546 RepID=UPI001C45B054|nr:PilC/PilY family type IV pilus protein [Variovorax sp. dw_308]
MKRSQLPKSTACALLLALAMLSSHAAATPLQFSTAPAGTSYRKPAPNVIVSVDDSGSMGDEGMQTLREALLDTFSQANVPDGAIRLAWQSMAHCYTIPSGGDCDGQNEMRVLDTAHRNNFKTWVRTLAAVGDTTSHRMLFNAGQYLRMPPGINSPWASVPGRVQEPMLGCRKAYNLFMTDGGWNTPFGNRDDPVRWDAGNPQAAALIPNADGTSRTLGDGTTPYATTNEQTQIYRDDFGAGLYGDGYSSGVLPTFSDLAFYYWATDLQPDLPNNVPRRIAREGSETFTDAEGTKTRTLTEFWNPRNDPANWQHLTLYTVGFNGAAKWDASVGPVLGDSTWSGEDYNRLMLGTTSWPNPLNFASAIDDTKRMPELWHSALNSRGKFIPAPTAASLAVAFKDVLNTIAAETGSALSSVTGSSGSARGASMSFEAGYSADGWHGAVTAYNVAAGTAVVSAGGAWGTAVAASGNTLAKPVSTATLLDASSYVPASRLVLTHNGTEGISWTWDSLSEAQKAALDTGGAGVDGKGQGRLAYLRGDRTQELSNGGTFRNRKSRHGDIVNSAPWVVPGKPAGTYNDATYATFRNARAARPSMLYVGANDGMLHGFDTADGAEKIAYVPQGLYGKLSQLSSPAYEHQYFVDGSPLSGDIKPVDGTWKTYVAGFLGAGGHGYFVLDATDPAAFASASPGSLVVLDKTGADADPDIGSIFSRPAIEQANPNVTQQITQLNDGRWALVTGNGYNSPNEKAVLLIQYLDGDKALVKINAGHAGGNGLGAPRLVDLNGDGKPDIAYAGDLKGQLWKFDLTGNTAGQWKLSFDNAPLYTAHDATGKAQPITNAPVWLPHPDGGLMLVFGTGRNLTNEDRGDASPQSIYGIRDNTVITRSSENAVVLSEGEAVSNGRLSLVAQTIGAEAGTSNATGSRLWRLSSNEVDFTSHRGWYLDLPAGERVVQNLDWFDGLLVDVPSAIPGVDGNTTEETCGPTMVNGRSYLTTLNAITGGAPRSQLYGYTASTAMADAPMTASRIESSLRYALKTDKKLISVCPSGQTCDDRDRLGKISLRPSWRQLR